MFRGSVLLFSVLFCKVGSIYFLSCLNCPGELHITCPWLASFPVFSLFLLSVPQFALCLFFVFHLRSCLEFPALVSVCVWFSIWVFCSSVVLGFPFCLFTLPPASFLIVFSLKLPFCSTVCPPGVCTWVFFLPWLKRKAEKLHFTLFFFLKYMGRMSSSKKLLNMAVFTHQWLSASLRLFLCIF